MGDECFLLVTGEYRVHPMVRVRARREEKNETESVFLVRYGRGRHDQEGVCVLGREGAYGAG